MDTRPTYKEMMAERTKVVNAIEGLTMALRAMPDCKHQYDKLDDAQAMDALQLAQAARAEADL